MPRVTKQIDDHGRTRQFYDDLPNDCKPSNISFQDSCVAYDLVEGSYPRSIESVLEAAERAMWDLNEDEPLAISRILYNSYVCEIAGRPGNCGIAYVNAAIGCIADHKLTPVHACHGDLTLSNCIHTWDDNIIFIDPGHHRGLPCRELDEAKILQSLDGFDMLRYGWPMLAMKPTDHPRIVIKPVHYALLLTHYVRLIPHMHKRGRGELAMFAIKRIKELDEWLR